MTPMDKYYDRARRRLVFIEGTADPSYWDRLWDPGDLRPQIVAPRNRFVVGTTKRYLRRGARILEGGCGRGDKVYSLRKHGYDALGVDSAERTVKRINEVMPDLKILPGDVRDLQFDDGSFDGYWSLGVIEHFYNGYEPVMWEMHRVLKTGGLLFLEAPAMSWIRRFKAGRGMYPEYAETPELVRDFFQFALDPAAVIADFEKGGFKLVEHGYPNDVEGLMEEMSLLRRPLQFLYESRHAPVKAMRICVGSVTRLFAANTAYYVFRKT
jgi:SAM-dependent methyltransferase